MTKLEGTSPKTLALTKPKTLYKNRQKTKPHKYPKLAGFGFFRHMAQASKKKEPIIAMANTRLYTMEWNE